MKKHYYIVIVLFILSAVILITNCQRHADRNCAGKKYMDILGREICIDSVPERVVSLAPSTTELIFALGKGAVLTGVTNQCDFPERALSIKKVGDFNRPSIELILSCEPDIILAGNQIPDEAINLLEGMGLKVFVVEAETVRGIYKVIDDLGSILGAASEAKKLITMMQASISTITGKLRNEKTVSCYYMIAFGENGNWTAGSGSFIHEIIELAGGRNIADAISEPWYTIDLEVLLHADPDVILAGESAGDVTRLNQLPLYSSLKAVKQGRVIVVDDDLISRPGPRLGLGLAMIARALHPDVF